MSKTAFVNAKRGSTFRFTPENLFLVTDRTHPLYDKRVEWPLEEWLVKSIMLRGVIEPVLIGKYPDFVDADGVPVPVVIDGRRRVLHAREAETRLLAEGGTGIIVECVLRKVSESAASSMMIVANEHKVADTPINKARKMAHVKALGLDSDEELCEMFNVSTTALRDWDKLLELAEPVLDKLDAAKLTAHAALELHGLPRQEQIDALDAALAAANGTAPSANDMRKAVKAKASKPQRATRQRGNKAKLRSMRKEINPVLSAALPADLTDEMLNTLSAGSVDVISSPKSWNAFRAGIRWAAQLAPAGTEEPPVGS